MRTVFKSGAEVCHMWASQTQQTGRAGNISFDGDTIYSYSWWPMARFVGDSVLIRDWSYSNSTSKHMNHMKRAVPDFCHRIYCANPRGAHADNIAHYLEKIRDAFDKFQRARKAKGWYLREQSSVISNLIEYCTLFSLDIPDYTQYALSTPENMEKIKQQEARNEELRQAAEARRQELINKAADVLAGIENDWMEGKTNETGLSIKGVGYYGFEQTRLRISRDEVQTSMGAFVPVREAKILLSRIRSGQDIKGFKIGSYTVIGLNGVLKIGCHEITREEIDRFATANNW